MIPSNNTYNKNANYQQNGYFPNNHANDSCQNSNYEKKYYSDSAFNSNNCFEIFGIKLFFDDLLILALLFILYKEDVKDSSLYIVLILLLLN